VNVEWTFAGDQESAIDCFTISRSPPPPPPPALDPRDTFVGTRTICTTYYESLFGTPCLALPMTITITGGASSLDRTWGYTLTTNAGDQCFGATIASTGAMQVRLKTCGSMFPVGDYYGAGMVTTTTRNFDRLNAFPLAQRSGVVSSDFTGTRIP